MRQQLFRVKFLISGETDGICTYYVIPSREFPTTNYCFPERTIVTPLKSLAWNDVRYDPDEQSLRIGPWDRAFICLATR